MRPTISVTCFESSTFWSRRLPLPAWLVLLVVWTRLRAELEVVAPMVCRLLGVKGRSGGWAALSLPKETLLMARLRLPLPELSPSRVLPALL
jgi:hypothetical protein